MMWEDHHHIQEPAPNAEKTCHQIRQPSQEDGEAEAAEEEGEGQGQDGQERGK